MLNIRIICVGKLKESFYVQACAEYIKRLGPYCRLEITELPEAKRPQNPSPTETEAALKKEAESILGKIPVGAYVIALCIEGRQYDSPGLSALMEKAALRGSSKLCFIIGGSDGMHKSVKDRAEVRLSMSQMTFPHHLARVMLLEQIYRALKIQEGSSYHK